MSAIDLDWLIALDSQIKEWQNEASNASSVSSSGGRAVSVEEYEAITRRRDGSDGVS